jgi:hypothetical protein
MGPVGRRVIFGAVMPSGWPVLRAFALLLSAGLAVHELRYLIAFGGGAEQTLGSWGHGYLGPARLAIGALIAVALGQLLVRIAAAAPDAAPRERRLRVLWPAAAVALLGIYAGQELAEGVLSHGHPGGWHGVFGAGGWIAVPLAMALGALVAFGLRVSQLAESCSRGPLLPAARLTAAPPLRLVCTTVVAARNGRAVADHLAGRGPPPFSV